MTTTYAVRQTAKKLIRIGLIVGYHPQLTSDPRPARIRSAMPEHVREYFESYGLQSAVKGFGELTGNRIDIHDKVIAAMASKHLEPYRDLLWARASGIHWKKILPRLQMPKRSALRHYSQALMTFAVVYGLVNLGEVRRAA